MKRAALLASAFLATMGGVALAQEEDDPMTQLRACSMMEGAERLECLDKLSRAITSTIPPAAQEEDRWVISLTRSPLDYSPIATATIPSPEEVGSGATELSIRCRGGRTEIVLAGSAVSSRGDDYTISYRINGGPPVQIAAAAPSFGSGIALKVDAVALIQSLPAKGELALHLAPRLGASHDAFFSLLGLERVRAKIAAPCKWPHAIAKPNN